jgi:hypothetical protein
MAVRAKDPQVEKMYCAFSLLPPFPGSQYLNPPEEPFLIFFFHSGV